MLRTGSLSKLLLIRESFLRLVYFKQVPLVHRRQHSTFSCSEIVACWRYWTGQRSTSVTPRRTLSRLTLKEKVSRFHTEIKTKTRQLRQAALAFSWKGKGDWKSKIIQCHFCCLRASKWVTNRARCFVRLFECESLASGGFAHFWPRHRHGPCLPACRRDVDHWSVNLADLVLQLLLNWWVSLWVPILRVRLVTRCGYTG